MTEPLLQLNDVHTHIGPYHILHGVDFAIPAGELTMLLGRNGAGKTTTLRTIMGLWQASSGRIRFDGSDITAASTPDIARSAVATRAGALWLQLGVVNWDAARIAHEAGLPVVMDRCTAIEHRRIPR